MSEIACTLWEVDGYEVLRHWQGKDGAPCAGCVTDSSWTTTTRPA